VPQRDLSLKHGVSKSMISIIKKKTKKIYANGSAKMKRNRASKFVTMKEALLGFVRQARDRNFPLTCEIINIKAKVFAEKLGNEP
jgi:nitrogen-specific signal transduction histidine kinase